jgi:hypothetical protein
MAGFECCGQDPECVYAAPLAAVNLLLALAAIPPDGLPEEEEAPADGAQAQPAILPRRRWRATQTDRAAAPNRTAVYFELGRCPCP